MTDASATADDAAPLGAASSLRSRGNALSAQSAPPVSDDEQRARLVLPRYVADYYATGTGSGQSLAEASQGWAAVRFRPRILHGLSSVTTATTVLDVPLDTPVLVAPMAQQLGADREGEAATARGAYAAGSLIGVSTHTGVPFADITATGTPWWFQVYVMRNRELTERLVQRAATAGARAIVLTADMNALLPRDLNPRHWPEGRARTRHANLTADELAAAGVRGLETDPTVGPDTVDWLRALTGLPVVVKGVLRADDARRVVDAGAAGVVVSTHGGRRMGASVTSAAALPEVVDAVGAEVEVYADSGIRSGEHAAAALALGARAVFVGRPVLWALAADGDAGVTRVLNELTEDLRQVMMQLGAPTPADLTPDLIG